ncbi:hypothetical protein [Massilia sp. CCM 8734]|uniref:hypothetical protein n=1 Tax=Massilia sp. CCM 8734 TaxID=2609283 RepID=UPI001423A8F9|nr:hypothetical protein [Massilia sp. CCM 8734]NHZ94527.1 hypothetical protein [Massilia sp. CCM 8734]
MATQSISSLQAALPVHSVSATAPARPADSSEAMGKAGFDHLAGAGALKAHLPAVRLPLARRLSRTLTSPLPSAQDEPDTPLNTAAARLVAKLEGKADDGGDPWQGLDDPLQQQTLLDQARQLLDQQGGDGARRPAGRDRLDAMQAELAAHHGAAIAQGQRAADALEGALATLDAAPATLSALRQQFGAPASGRRDAPMAPAALLDILLA